MIGKHFKMIIPEKWNDAGIFVRRHTVKFKVIDVEGDTALVVYPNGSIGSLKIDDTFEHDPDHHKYDPRGNKKMPKRKRPLI